VAAIVVPARARTTVKVKARAKTRNK